MVRSGILSEKDVKVVDGVVKDEVPVVTGESSDEVGSASTSKPTRVEEYSNLLYSLVSADVHRKGIYSSVSEAAKDQDFQNERMKVWNRRKSREAPISRAMQAQIFESFDRIVKAEGGDPSSVPGITDYEKSLAQGAIEAHSRYGEGGMAEFEDSVIEGQLGPTAQSKELAPEKAISMKSQYYESVIGYQDREIALDQIAASTSSDEEVEVLSRVRRMIEFEDALIDHLNENSISLSDGLNNADFIRRFQMMHSLLPSEVEMVVNSMLEGYSDEESQ